MRLHTRAFAVAGGVVAGGAAFAGTLLLLVASGEGAAPPGLGAVLFGYSVSVAGAFVGALWAYVYGFFLGGIFAFVYNLTSAPAAPVLE